ncbi:MAG: phage tail protein [Brachybacterium sp.]|uniref:phage tail protein n=1 Tax=Brachybacterium vulturis TaxID=2017484 RepID=UPI00264A663A|nr:phage tail protein [Brachybacterium sp.]MDN5900545.1 phage tail protein [Brachybacterium sp.]
MPQDYPIPRYHFQVQWGSARLNFTEVTGLVMEREKIEYRHSDSKDFAKLVMPGLVKNGNITLKRGTFEQDIDFATWHESVTNTRAENRRDVLINLLNEKHEPVAAWKAIRCFPVKTSGADLKSDANEIAIESVEIAHEGLTQMEI